MYYLYEGRTIRGIGLIGWSLLTQTVVVIGLGVTSVGLSLLYGAALTGPMAALGPLMGVLALLCGIELAEVGMAIVFLVGFFQLYTGRHEYGLEQARSLERALVFLIVYVVLSAVSAVYSVSAALVPGLPGWSGLPVLTGNVFLAPLGAFFAGLTLAHAARGVANPAAKSRLRTALILGMAGAAIGPGLVLLATAANPITLGAITTGLIASALAGNGISAISLFLFWSSYLETRRRLEAGTPAPVLPRIDQLYPWLYRPLYPYPSYNPQAPQTPKP